MKRISFRGLRISSPSKYSHSTSPDIQERNNDNNAGCNRTSDSTTDESNTYERSASRHPPAEIIRRQRKRMDKKGFFRALRRKFKSRAQKKRDSSSGGESEISDDKHSDCDRRATDSLYRRDKVSRPADRHICAPAVGAKQHSSYPVSRRHIRIQHCISKEESSNSKSEDDPAAAAAQLCHSKHLPPDTADYGHTSAPGSAAELSDMSSLQGTPVCRHRPPSSEEGAAEGAAPAPGLLADDAARPLTPLQPLYNEVKDTPKTFSITKELFRLSRFGWYWGPISRQEAEEKLTEQRDGAFLVRDSSDERYLLSLSFRSYGRTLHTRIEHCNGTFSFYAQPESEGYSSIVDLIEFSMRDSVTGVFCYSRARTPGSPSFPVRLTKPVSRFTEVRSLQYLCRFIIRQYTRIDHIAMLPLPTRIKGWLGENQY